MQNNAGIILKGTFKNACCSYHAWLALKVAVRAADIAFGELGGEKLEQADLDALEDAAVYCASNIRVEEEDDETPSEA